MGHSTRRLMMGAAGAGGDPTYVEDVFSTYLWRGDGVSGRPIINGIKLGNANSGTSVLFNDNVNDYLQIAHTTDLCVGSGDFTIECWAYHIGDFGSFDGLFGNWTGGGDNGYILETVGSGATTDLEFYYYPDGGGSYVGPVQGGTVSSNQWNHLCVCRSGNTIRLFVNGTMHGSGTSITTGIRNGTSNFTIGGQVAGGGWWNGYITDLRVTKGQALYTSNFTPSTDPLTTTSQGATASNVKLLCCNKNTATGSTKTPGTITAHGETHIKSFGPFTGTDGEGGLVWMKSRTTGNVNVLFDTERGANQRLRSDSNLGQNNVDLLQPSFTNSGFTVGSGNEVNGSGNDYTSWTWRKQKGFFDIVTYTGTGSVINLSHSLGCVPGCVMIKKTSATDNWSVYHRGLDASAPEDYWISLNHNYARMATGGTTWNDTKPTSTHVTIGAGDQNVNTNGATYVAYIFAGGESTAATARSVVFDVGNATALTTAHSSDFDFGSGDFTVEAWIKPTNASQTDPTVVSVWNFPDGRRSWGIFGDTAGSATAFDGTIRAAVSPDGQFATRTEISGTVNLHQWNHVAFTRSGNTLYFFINGVSQGTASYTGSVYSNTSDGIMIGGMGDDAPDIRNAWDGSISNVRVIKGTAVYTSSFRPPTEPLTNITNTKLLCCNNSSTTGSTVTPGTITAHNGPTASTDSPFDDPEGFKFGEGRDQNIIKTGSYTGTGTNGDEVYVGFEPQWVMLKRTDSTSNWVMLDVMRGIPGTNAEDDQALDADQNGAEYNNVSIMGITPTGWKWQHPYMNASGGNYVYIAFRRPDGYVGKPAEVGTDVFAMDTGNGSSTIPTFDSSTFPVDFALLKRPAATSNFLAQSRLSGVNYLLTNASQAEVSHPSFICWDSNVGWAKQWDNLRFSWMFKRHAGLDVVTYNVPTSSGQKSIKHNLGREPEMIWLKYRDGSDDWLVYNKYLGGGTDPWDYFLALNKYDAQSNTYPNYWGTSSSDMNANYFTINQQYRYTGDHLMMLFASVDGISKVGSYVGSDSDQTITIGFQPRFIIIKGYDSSFMDWYVLDTVRGWGPGNDPYLALNSNTAQGSTSNWGAPTSTGFTLTGNNFAWNDSGYNYLYYAHA